jgi:uncharacterized membrane protein YqjE
VTAPGAGLFASLRRLVDTAVGIVQVRLELLGTELEQEKLRVFEALLWAGTALMALGLTLALAVAFVVLLFWDGYRLAAVGVLTLLFAGGTAWLVHKARERLQAPDGGAFALTLGELRKDRRDLGVPPE